MILSRVHEGAAPALEAVLLGKRDRELREIPVDTGCLRGEQDVASKVGEEGGAVRWEYQDRMVMFTETPEGLTSGLDWLNDAGRDGWELVGVIPLIAPNKDGVAYGTVGEHLIFKRPGA